MTICHYTLQKPVATILALYLTNGEVQWKKNVETKVNTSKVLYETDVTLNIYRTTRTLC
jgi:hypothetical protein